MSPFYRVAPLALVAALLTPVSAWAQASGTPDQISPAPQANAAELMKKVDRFLGSMAEGPIEMYELANLDALNFLVHGALGGGGSVALQLDAQGKTSLRRWPMTRAGDCWSSPPLRRATRARSRTVLKLIPSGRQAPLASSAPWI